MVKYTISMVNYNMSHTLADSVKSILNQVTDEYEVFVVDGGSSDGSLAILSELSETHTNFRYLSLEDDSQRRLGRDRQISIEQANGEYILFQMDTDDYYESAVTDFVTVYHQLESGLGFEFMVKGCAISIAPRELLLETGFRNIGRREDRDLWRRLFAKNAIVWLDHKPFWRSLGYDDENYSFVDQVLKVFDEITSDIQAGVSVSGSARWLLDKGPMNKWAYIQLAMLPLAYLRALARGRYTTPDRYRNPRALFRDMKAARMTLSQLADLYNVDIDPTELSDYGRDVFFPKETGHNYRGQGIDLVEATNPSQVL